MKKDCLKKANKSNFKNDWDSTIPLYPVSGIFIF